jgi:hypothetical protein
MHELSRVAQEFMPDTDKYSYVGSNPLRNSDEPGLVWPINCYRCFKDSGDWDDAAEKCRKEYDECNNIDKLTKFHKKYKSNFVAGALLQCTIVGFGGPEKYNKLIKSCTKCGGSGFFPNRPAAAK